MGVGGWGDTFDYLLVLAQENHCHVQEFIQQNSFQRQFLIVARKESTFSVQKKKEDVFFIVRGFFYLFYFFTSFADGSLVHTYIFFSFAENSANSASLFLYVLCIHENRGFLGARPFRLSPSFEQKPK